MARKEAKLSTVKKWEKVFKCKLEYDIANQKVLRLRCVHCKTCQSRINSMKNLHKTWSNTGDQPCTK